MLFAVALATAVFLQYLTFEALNLLAFWIDNTCGLRFATRVVTEGGEGLSDAAVSLPGLFPGAGAT